MFCENSVRWLYWLEKNFSWDSGLSISQDYAFKDKTGVVRLILERGGRITVTQGYESVGDRLRLTSGKNIFSGWDVNFSVDSCEEVRKIGT